MKKRRRLEDVQNITQLRQLSLEELEEELRISKSPEAKALDSLLEDRTPAEIYTGRVERIEGTRAFLILTTRKGEKCEREFPTEVLANLGIEQTNIQVRVEEYVIGDSAIYRITIPF